MAVLSVLKSAGVKFNFNQLNLSCITKLIGKNATGPGLLSGRSIQPIIIRKMSDHKRLMDIRPSNYQWKMFLDQFHFYFMLGAIPLTIITFLVNIYIGPATLSEIPEGYVPKHWEYYQHPISRFYSRYFTINEQQMYEKFMHFQNEEHERMRWKALEKKVKSLIAERDDYKAWYYIPETGKYARIAKRTQLEEEENFTGRSIKIG